jgi:putative transposase
LRLRIREIAHARPRFGYLRIHVMLRREGWPVNKKRVYRWYRFEGLRVADRDAEGKPSISKAHRGQETMVGERGCMVGVVVENGPCGERHRECFRAAAID